MKELDFSQDIRAQLEEIEGSEEEVTQEAWAAEEKSGKKLNKPFRTSGGPKKFSVYVKNEKGNVVKVNFGDPNMSIKRDDPARRKSFRARHGCDNPGPKTKAKYWSCKMWSKKTVTKMTKGEEQTFEDLEDEMAAEFGEGNKVICPITDPYVVHHGALGSYVTVHLLESGRATEIAGWIRGLQGVTEVLEKSEAAALLELPADRIGDLVVMSAADTVLGRSPGHHDLSQLDRPLLSLIHI